MANMGTQVATQANGTKGEYDAVRMQAGRLKKVEEEVPNNYYYYMHFRGDVSRTMATHIFAYAGSRMHGPWLG